MADSFVDYIRRKRGYGGAVSQQEKEAVDAGYNFGGYPGRSLGSDRGVGYGNGYQSFSGGAGSATAAAAAREARGGIGSDYRSGGGGNYPTSGSSSSGYTGGSAGGGGIGSDYAASGGSYRGDVSPGSGFQPVSRGGGIGSDYRASGGIYSYGQNDRPAMQGAVDVGSRYDPRNVGIGGGIYTGGGAGFGPRTPGSEYAGGQGRVRSVPTTTVRYNELDEDRATRERGVAPTSTTGTHGAAPSLGGRYVPPARGAPGSGGAASRAGIPGTAAHESFFSSIMKAEGTTKHGYNTVYGGGYKDLENMTINDVLSEQKGMIRNTGHSPMGAFQITRDTLIDHGKRVGLDFAKDLFNAENQRKVALSIAATNPSLSKWDGFRKNPDQLAIAKKAYGMLKGLPTPPGITSGTVAMYRGRQPTAGGIGSDYAASASRGMGSSPGSSYGSGGYKGGTYGGAAGSSISQGVGGAYKNR